MTDDEIEAYKVSNEPTKILYDKVGRWKHREWKLDKGKIIERYDYENNDDDSIKKNKDSRKYRNCFEIKVNIKDSEDE